MAGFTTEAKVGAFVLIGLLILGYMSVRLGGFKIGQEESYEVFAVFPTASGLKIGVPVEIAGIEVGLVKGIALEDGQARVRMNVRADVPLPIDSRAVIRTKGVLGDKYVELSPGTKGAPMIEPGGRLVQASSPADVDQLISKVSAIAEDIKRVTSSLSDAIGGEEGSNNIKQTVANMREMSETLAKLVKENNEYLNTTFQNFAEFSSDLRGMSANNKDNIQAILVSFRDASDKMTRTLTAMQDITEKINRGEGTIGALVNDTTTVESLNSTMASLKDISEKINSGQGTIGKLVNDTTTADKIDEALSGVNDYLSATNRFKFYIDYRGEWMMAHEDLKSTLNVRIQPREDKYYLLGVTTDTWGTYRKSEKTYTVNGVSTTTVEETRDKGGIKFNAQIAKRYHDFVFRGGLIESSGGFGIDYLMLDDSLKATFEAFSGDVDSNMHLRFAVSYDFWKYFYMTAGYDDFTSDQDRESGFFGLGLRFNDEDLKYLLTSAPIPTGN